jgi:EAL domain-containing protein (putative c-di-GMP-specific phosphodiesterase class I)
MGVTIEGVETDRHVAFLDHIAGDQAQGFFFGRPAPTDELPVIIASDAEDAASRPRSSKKAGMVA